MSSIDVVTTSFSRKNYLGLLVIIAGNEVTELQIILTDIF